MLLSLLKVLLNIHVGGFGVVFKVLRENYLKTGVGMGECLA